MANPFDLLAELIRFDTQNPGGDEVGICRHLAKRLEERGADEVAVVEVPRAAQTGAYVYARFGAPRVLFNVHIDTVPAQRTWKTDPFCAERAGGRIIGLGAADTKGAAAAILAALEQVVPANAAILFSGDEERGTTCVRAFLASEHARGLERAIVCEPTGRSAGVLHRGIRGYRAHVQGVGGHSSLADTMPKPMVTMARLAVALDELGVRYLERGPAEMRGICMNVADLSGGVAFNVVPAQASLSWSVRPPPGFDGATFDRELAACMAAAGGELRLELDTQISRDGFACRDYAPFAALLGDSVRAAVTLHFWTEAAILSAAGIDAVVIGPGDIAQAHAADEFVTEDDLDWAVELFRHAFAFTRR